MAHTRIVQYSADDVRDVRTVVSLHSHTHHSKEVLWFLPAWVSRIPIARHFVNRELRKHQGRAGRALDFSRAYWCPPLPPKAVFDSEAAQIADRFGAAPLVSITDHDNITAPLGLAAAGLGASCPVSVEWTVPFRGTVFHLGMHNLPPDSALVLVREFQAFTRTPVEPRLADLLAWAHGEPSTLIVLNHPLWNAHVDEDQDNSTLAAFVRLYRGFLHATEINGYRSHAENKAVIRLGREWDLPVLAGGDRHGRAPNAMLNTTTATSFDGFVDEVRRGGVAHTVVMPEYREHPATRVLEVVSDVLRHDRRAEPWQQHWSERVFVIREDGRHQPLAQFWAPRAPFFVRACVGTASLLGSGTARQALRLGLAVEDGGVL